MPKPPLNFNPGAAILLNNKATITLTVDLNTGQIAMTTDRPDLNLLAVIDIFTCQIQSIVRSALVAAQQQAAPQQAGKPEKNNPS